MDEQFDLGMSHRLVVMAVGDPESALDEATRDLLAEAMLEAMKGDPSSAEQWEIMRNEVGSDDERTVYDLTTADIREFCEKIYAAVDAGLMPNPFTELSSQMTASDSEWLPDFEPTAQEVARVDELGERLPGRFAQIGLAGADDTATPDFFVALASMCSSARDSLEQIGCSSEAQIMEAATGVAMRMFLFDSRNRNQFN